MLVEQSELRFPRNTHWFWEQQQKTVKVILSSRQMSTNMSARRNQFMYPAPPLYKLRQSPKLIRSLRLL